MRKKIVKLFEIKGFKPLVRTPETPVEEPTVATNLSGTKTTQLPQEKKEKFIIKKNKAGDYLLIKTENGLEVDSHAFPNIKILKDILSQDAFKNLNIDYRISNAEENALKATDKPPETTPELPKETPLDFGSPQNRNLFNNRDSTIKTYISPQEKQKCLSDVIKAIKAKLMNKNAMIQEIKELKSSDIVNDVSNEFMGGHVFNDKLDLASNIVKYVMYLVYDELTKYLIINDNTKLLRTSKDITRRGGDISALIKELAKEVLPIFERYLYKQEKSELFNAFQEAMI